MRLGLGLGLSGGSRYRFNPASLFGLNEQGVWYDPSDVANLAWRRNLLVQTEAFDTASWGKDSCTIVANTTLAPDGTTTADRLVSAAATAQTGVAQTTTVQSGVVHTASYYVQANGARYVQLLWGGSQSANYANFDLQTGTVTGGTYTAATISAAANGFYRITISSTIAVTPCGSFLWLVDNGTVGRGGSYTGNGTSGIFLWGAQLELGSVATDYQRITDVNTEVIERFPTATLYQDTIGTIPVTTPGQAVALMLDKSRGLVASTKSGFLPGVVGSYFTTPDSTASSITGDIDIRANARLVDWTPAGPQTLVGKRAGSAPNFAYQFFINTNGRPSFQWGTSSTTIASGDATAAVPFADGAAGWVRVTREASSGNLVFYTSVDGSTWTQLGATVAAASGSMYDNSTALGVGAYPTGGEGQVTGRIYRAQVLSGINGTLAVDFNPTLYTGGATFTAATGEVWTINGTANITPEGNHAVQATAASRPIYGVVPQGGRRNQVLWSEGFNVAPWTSRAGATVSANTTEAPDGTITADTITFTTSTNDGFYQDIAGSSSGASTVSVWARVASGNRQFRLMVYNGTLGVNMSGEFTATTTWQRFSYTSTFLSALGVQQVSVMNTGVSPTVGNLIVWGAQLETGSTATPYQRVSSIYDVTEAGVQSCSYLFFDGGSDFMSTSTITPGVDKVQVFSGLRKLSDAVAMVAEFSADFGNNAGSFGAYTFTDFRFASRGTATEKIALGGPVAPSTQVFTGLGDISGDTSTLRLNSVQVGQSTLDQGTGNYLAYPLYIGRRNATTNLYFNGELYGLITRFGATLDAPTIASTETYVAGKTGIVI